MRKVTLSGAVAVFCLAGALCANAEEVEGGDRARAFWASVAQGDTAAMKEFYAEKVRVMRGSELLKPEWGLPGGGERDKDLLVARDDLVAAYARMIEKIGRERWAGIFTKIPSEKLRVEPLDVKTPPPGVSRSAIGLTVFTGPGDDRLLFVLDKSADGRWQVVAEATDY